MSETVALLLILTGLHALESCVVVPNGSIVLWRTITGRFAAVRAATLLRVNRGRLVFLNPLNTRAHVLVTGLPHILPIAEGVLDVAPELDDARRRRPFVPWRKIGPAKASGAFIHCEGLGAIPCGSHRAARLWARLLNALRTAPAKRRTRIVERWQRLRFSTAIVDRRAGRLRAACTTLERVSSLCLLLVAAAGTVAVLRHSVWIILGFLGTGVVSGLVLSVCYWVAHARLHPRAWTDRLGRAAMIAVCFPVAFRARAPLGRDILAHADPAAAAAVLLPPDRARDVLAGMTRRWTHHAAPPPRGSVDETQLQEGSRQMLALLAATARERHLGRPGEEPTPKLDDPSVRSWCPRCHATYVHAGGTCTDCPGVPLIAASR